MTELRYGYTATSTPQVLEDPPVLDAWHADLRARLTDDARSAGYEVVGDVTIHEPVPLWWIETTDRVTGERRDTLVGGGLATFGEHDELGPPSAYEWHAEAQVRPTVHPGTQEVRGSEPREETR